MPARQDIAGDTVLCSTTEISGPTQVDWGDGLTATPDNAWLFLTTSAGKSSSQDSYESWIATQNGFL